MAFICQTFFEVKGRRVLWKSVAFPLSCITEMVCSSGPNEYPARIYTCSFAVTALPKAF